jgi:hypothetical protein
MVLLEGSQASPSRPCGKGRSEGEDAYMARSSRLRRAPWEVL